MLLRMASRAHVAIRTVGAILLRSFDLQEGRRAITCCSLDTKQSMELFFLLLFITPFVFSLSDVPATNSSGCPAYYNHDTHWCAKNSYGEHLCEIVDGLPYFLCGTDQCFNNLQYEYASLPG